MILIFVSKLGLNIKYTNIKIQKINNSIFEIFKMALASFKIENKLSKTCFFQKSFLLSNINIKISLNMLFLTLNKVNI